MKIHTPSPFGLGILAGIEGTGTYDNPYDEWYETHEYERWKKGYAEGERILELLAAESEA